MSKVKRESIVAVGLEAHLDRTKDVHNGQGYKEFCFYVKYRVSNAAIARMFHVGNRETIKKWKAFMPKDDK